MIRLLLPGFLRRFWFVFPFALFWMAVTGKDFGNEFEPWLLSIMWAMVFVSFVDQEVRPSNNGRFLFSLPTAFADRVNYLWTIGVALPVLTAVVGLVIGAGVFHLVYGGPLDAPKLFYFYATTSVCCAFWYFGLLYMNPSFKGSQRRPSRDLLIAATAFILLAGTVRAAFVLWKDSMAMMAAYGFVTILILYASYRLTPWLLERQVAAPSLAGTQSPRGGADNGRISLWDRIQMSPFLATPIGVTIAMGWALLFIPFGMLPFIWGAGHPSERESMVDFAFQGLASPPLIYMGLGAAMLLSMGWMQSARFFASLPVRRSQVLKAYLGVIGLGLAPVWVLLAWVCGRDASLSGLTVLSLWMGSYGFLALLSAFFLVWGATAAILFGMGFATSAFFILVSAGSGFLWWPVSILLFLAGVGLLYDAFHCESSVFRDRSQELWNTER